MFYIIFDLEATCWDGDRSRQNETIEIGALKIDENKEIISEFQLFIQPTLFPELSEFCTQLTSIQQTDVNEAPKFPEAIQRFQEWIGTDYLLCSWGFYDRIQFKNDCELHGLQTEWLTPHISLKHQHGKIRNLKRPMGMKNALKKEKIPLTGTHHRGIDDARNIAQIFLKHFEKWRTS